jgi:cell division protein FtsZ
MDPKKDKVMMQFDLPKELPSIIKVIGVGGGGSNAVNHMYNKGIEGVEFLVCNTDQQALEHSPVPWKISLGPSITEGRGAGALPEVGKHAALENLDEIREILSRDTKMVFITAGMGGGTGTGAAPIIAALAKEMGILTVGIVTIPFAFEGKKRKMMAEKGIEELKENVDTLLVVCNDKLREIHGNLKLKEAFGHADDILTVAAKSIAELITCNLHMNVDFADVQTVMKNSGVAIMGAAAAEGEDRALTAVTTALDSPLLNDNQILGANYILLSLTFGDSEITMDEMGEINEYVQEQAGNSADIIMGVGEDPSLGDKIAVTIIATGFKTKDQLDGVIEKKDETVFYHINGDVMDESSKEQVNSEVPSDVSENTESTETMSDDGFRLMTRDEAPEPAATHEAEEEPSQDISQDPVAENDTPVVHYLDDNMNEVDDTLSPMSELSSSESANPEPESVNDITASDEANDVSNETEEQSAPVFEFKVGQSHSEKNEESATSEDEESYEPLPPVIRNQEAQTVPESQSEEQLPADPDDYMNSQLEKTRERIHKLRELSYNFKMRNSEDISRFEKEPAYKRRNVELKDVPDASSDEVSRYTLSSDKDNKPEIKPNNSFLHDKVD